MIDINELTDKDIMWLKAAVTLENIDNHTRYIHVSTPCTLQAWSWEPKGLIDQSWRSGRPQLTEEAFNFACRLKS